MKLSSTIYFEKKSMKKWFKIPNHFKKEGEHFNLEKVVSEMLVAEFLKEEWLLEQGMSKLAMSERESSNSIIKRHSSYLIIYFTI